MASLNTLRTRGGIIVTIVIGIALLAFLLGDFTPRGCSEHGIGQIGNKKVDYMEYAQETDKNTVIFQMMAQKDALTAEESDQVREMTWQAMIMKYSYQPGFEKLGINVSDAEEADMGGGVYISPVLQSMFANPQTGAYDPKELQKFHAMASEDASGRTMMMWQYIKGQMNENRVMEKYLNLVTNAMFVNDLEVEAGVKADNYTYDARVITQHYAEVPDSLVKISSGDIRSYYNDHKARFIRESSRKIEYVVFDLLPSQDDYNGSEEHITSIAKEFAESSIPMSYATLNSQTRPDQRYLKESEIADGAIAAAIWDKPNAVYGPILAGDIYTLARLGEVKMLPDTIGANNIILLAADKELADSLAGAITAGADFSELARKHSLDQNVAKNGGDMGRFAPEDLRQFSSKMADELLDATIGKVVIIPEGEIIHISQLSYKSPLVKKAQVAVIKYNVEPSDVTRSNIYNEASNFIADATGSYDNFKKAVTENALIKKVAHISNTDREVYGFNDSRELVRWAYGAKSGAVSDLLEIGGDFVIAALTEVQETGTATVDEVTDEIRPIVMRLKKGEILAQKLQGENIDQIAEKTNSNIIEANGVSHSSFQIDEIGVEQRLVGAICSGTETGKLSKPVFGNMGVFVFEIAGAHHEENSTKESVKVKQESMFISYIISQRVGQSLFENAKITDNRVKYF